MPNGLKTALQSIVDEVLRLDEMFFEPKWSGLTKFVTNPPKLTRFVILGD